MSAGPFLLVGPIMVRCSLLSSVFEVCLPFIFWKIYRQETTVFRGAVCLGLRSSLTVILACPPTSGLLHRSIGAIHWLLGFVNFQKQTWVLVRGVMVAPLEEPPWLLQPILKHIFKFETSGLTAWIETTMFPPVGGLAAPEWIAKNKQWIHLHFKQITIQDTFGKASATAR